MCCVPGPEFPLVPGRNALGCDDSFLPRTGTDRPLRQSLPLVDLHRVLLDYSRGTSSLGLEPSTSTWRGQGESLSWTGKVRILFTSSGYLWLLVATPNYT